MGRLDNRRFASKNSNSLLVEIVAFPGGGSHSALRVYESPFEIILHKKPIHGEYHMESDDMSLFLKITTPPPQWPQHGWEVQEALVIFTKQGIVLSP